MMDYKAKIKELEELEKKYWKKQSQLECEALENDDVNLAIEINNKWFEKIDRPIGIYHLCDKYNVSIEDAAACFDINREIETLYHNLLTMTWFDEKYSLETNKDMQKDPQIQMIKNGIITGKHKIEMSINALTSNQKTTLSTILKDKKDNGLPLDDFTLEDYNKAIDFAQDCLEKSMLPKNEGTGKNDGEGK